MAGSQLIALESNFNMVLRTPVLFLIFNRPKHTQRVFQQIRSVQPTHLFISADGPRPQVAGELEKSNLVRSIVDQIDWDCEVHTNFYSENLGCKKAVSSGISWFFEQVEEGIILEDDCFPEESFFAHCACMLELYRDDKEIMHISGTNPTNSICKKLPSSYVFSRYPFIWGWATWRRAWNLYDAEFTGLEAAWSNPNSGISTVSTNRTVCRYLFDKFQRTQAGEFNTWDYAWFYSILKNKGLCLNPCDNLIQNIGFDEEATHTRSSGFTHRLGKISAYKNAVVHPLGRQLDTKLEKAFFHASQKNAFGLLLRRLVPRYFFKALPKKAAKPFIHPLWMGSFMSS